MIKKNERALLYLLSHTKSLTKLKIVKLMFLISKERNFYDFVPYHYGPFSFQMYQDMRHLENAGYLSQTDDEVHFINQVFPKPESSIQMTIEQYLKNFGEMSDDDLIDYVYQTYPETTIFSKRKQLASYSRDEVGIINIGYEGKNIDSFLTLLLQYKVQTLIDVRKNSYSMKYGYSKNQLHSTLGKMGINFIHVPELGIKSDQRQNLTHSGYEELFRTYAKSLGEKEEYLDVIKSRSQHEKVALMCFEASASDCHRGVISDRFRSEGLVVVDV